jgi:hypothetical protein
MMMLLWAEIGRTRNMMRSYLLKSRTVFRVLLLLHNVEELSFRREGKVPDVLAVWTDSGGHYQSAHSWNKHSLLLS